MLAYVPEILVPVVSVDAPVVVSGAATPATTAPFTEAISRDIVARMGIPKVPFMSPAVCDVPLIFRTSTRPEASTDKGNPVAAPAAAFGRAVIPR